MARLVWDNDNQRYYADLGEDGTLYVDSDAFSEIRSYILKDRFYCEHPTASREDFENCDHDKAYDEITEMLMEADEWTPTAPTLTTGTVSEFSDAWIVPVEH